MKRLERYELTDQGQAYMPNWTLERVEPYAGQVWTDGSEWCRAEDVGPLEDENSALVQALYNFVCAASTNGELKGLTWELEQAREALVAARGFGEEVERG